MELTVARHCVAIGQDGLSPLQRELIENQSRVRIAEAPTGAGKSYAFQRALRDRGARILFIVPTRRLAQNLASGLVQDLVRQDNWSKRRATDSVALWSSDQTATLKEQGVVSINGLRLRQMQALKLGNSGGEMIVAVPEVVSALLVRRRVEQGQAGVGVFDLLDAFDHIVFDEFHTIEARGFGLAALFARLVTVERDNGQGYGRARISFLSATPLDLLPTLARVGVPEDAAVLLSEEIVPDGRPLHGDVRLSLVDAQGVYDLILHHLPDIAAELEAGNQVVVIYNALADLEKDLSALARTLAEGGVVPSRVLVINSVRDSIARSLHQGGFAIGRKCDPLAYDLILATASVEMGVTFRNANLMLMEPGFEAMNFLQRYGRAARRGADGRVIVRFDQAAKGCKPWLRALSTWVEEHAGSRVGIEELTRVLSRTVQGEFAAAPADGTFGRLSARAIWCTALYWSVLLDHPSNRGHRRRHLLDHRPPGAGTLYRLEQEVRRLSEDPCLAEHVEHWLRLFRAQAFDLRTIEPKIRVVTETGEAFDYPRVWLERETRVFECGALVDDEIHIQGNVDDYWREEKERNAKRTWTCHFPHTARVQTLPRDERLMERWCRSLEDIEPYSIDWDDHPEERWRRPRSSFDSPDWYPDMTQRFHWNRSKAFFERIDRLALHGLHFQHINLCQRRAWMYLHRINFAQWNSRVATGSAHQATHYKRDRSTIGLLGLAPDRLDWNEAIVFENKGSGGASIAVDRQVGFYAAMLSIATGRTWSGRVQVLTNRRWREVVLDADMLDGLWHDSLELERLGNSDEVPRVPRIGLCGSCSLASFCGYD